MVRTTEGPVDVNWVLPINIPQSYVPLEESVNVGMTTETFWTFLTVVPSNK